MSVVYNGDHSIDFWNLNDQEALCVNSWDDLHLIPASRPYVANPEVLLQSVSIPNTNRRIDMTGSLTEGRTYNSRQGEWEFIIDHDKWPDWATCYRHLVQYFHGFKMAARLKDHDLERIYKGRIIVQSYAPNNDYSRIVLRYIFESGKVTDYGDLNLVFNVAWVDWSGGLYFQSKYSWNDTPSYPGAPSGVTFEPSISSVKSNQIYREANADDEPVAITVIVLPNKTEYEDGDTIEYEGIHVAALTKTGKRWTSGGFENGIIPFSQLSFPITEAKYTAGTTEQSLIVQWRSFETTFKVTVDYPHVEYISILVLPTKIEYQNGEELDYTGIQVVAYKENGQIWEPSNKYKDGILPFRELIFPMDKIVVDDDVLSEIVPVEWKRPNDNHVLETTFTANIVEGPNLIERTYNAYINNEATYISDYAFYGSPDSLRMASFKNVSKIGNYAFYSTSLNSLYLLYNGIVNISTTTTIGNNWNLRIYVPSSLYENYIIADIWSNYSSKFISYRE